MENFRALTWPFGPKKVKKTHIHKTTNVPFFIWRLDLMLLRLAKIHYLGHCKGWAPFWSQMALATLVAISGPKSKS
jgi:hypothetical protein